MPAWVRTAIHIYDPDHADQLALSVKAHSPDTKLKFHWETLDKKAPRTEYQISETNLLGDVSPQALSQVILSNQVSTPDFEVGLSEIPNLPQTPPVSPKTYFARLVFKDSFDQIMPGTFVSAKLTYQRKPSTAALELHGTFIKLKINSQVPVSYEAMVVSRELYTLGKKVSSASSAALATTHEIVLGQLQPGQPYQYVVTLKDKNGQTELLGKDFKTLRRRATVTFAELTVDDDSDDLSDGELQFAFFIDDENAPSGKPLFYPNEIDTAQLGTGEKKTLNIKDHVDDPHDLMPLRVTGFDDDWYEGPLSTLNTKGAVPINDPTLADGNDDRGEWVSATTTVNTEVQGSGEAFTAPFKLKADKKKLKFTVTGSYTVSYF